MVVAYLSVMLVPGGVQLNGWINEVLRFAVPREADSTTNHAIPGVFYLSAADLC
jgi:hypothetical protein